MALKKEQTQSNGVVGEYWIAEPHNDKRHEKTQVIMHLFKNQAIRESGLVPIKRERFNWDINGCYLTGSEVYSGVKESHLDEDGNETNWFVDAEDVL